VVQSPAAGAAPGAAPSGGKTTEAKKGAGGTVPGKQGGAAASAPSSQPSPTPAPAAPISPGDIEVAVVAVNGDPQPGLDFILKLPDGTEKSGKTGSDGVLRLSGLQQSGDCQLTFPSVRADPDNTSAGAGQIAYAGSPVSVPIGARSTVVLPPRVARAVLTGLFYDTDKSFLLPQAMVGIRKLVDFYKTHPKFQVLFSGHTDTVGPADYNLLLSVERALTMEAYLKDDVAAWDRRFETQQAAGQLWSALEINYMLSALPEDSDHFYTDKPVAANFSKMREATKKFQIWSNEARGTKLNTSGTVDGATRKEIVTAYMALEGTSLPKGTTTAHHGCGFFHLKKETGPNVDEPANRRAEVFFFEKVIKPSPRKCKSPGCAEYPQWHDAVQEEVNVDLPAADGRSEVTIQIVDELGLPVKKYGFSLKRDDGQVFKLETDDDGKLKVHLKAGEGFQLTVDDAQEMGEGDSIKTTSGQHFAAGKGGPA
jgi:hypothetical protein